MYATPTARWRTCWHGSGGCTGWPFPPRACARTSTRRSCGDCASRSTSPAPIPIPIANDGPTTPTVLRVAVDGRASVAGLALDAHGRGVHRDRGQLAGGGGVQRFLEIDPCLALAVAFLAHDHRLRQTRTTTRCEGRSEEHTSELQSLMRIPYAVFCL